MKVKAPQVLVLLAGLFFAGLLCNTQAVELSVGDAYYLGLITDSSPANPDAEVGYINGLIQVGPGESSGIYVRTASSLTGPFPMAILSGADKDDPPVQDPDNSNYATIIAKDYQYVLGKYGNESHVWFLGGVVDVVQLPWSSLSHISLYNGNLVPDGGSAILLLGMAMIGLGALQRRFLK